MTSSLAIPATYRTASEWWDAMGNVPLHRIVFDPPPGSATEADLLRIDAREDRICELVDGTLIEKIADYDEALINANFIYHLGNFIFPRELGILTGAGGPMRILPNRVRVPDLAFVSFDRLPRRKTPRGPIPELFPDLAVEIISDGNTEREMQIKLREYFAAGTRLVWYVDRKSQSVKVCDSSEKTQCSRIGSVLTGGDVLPGFEVTVASIFDLD